MNDWKQKLEEALKKATDNEIRPGDESQLAENPLNATIGALGLPEDWKQSVADYKQATTDLPMNMGMGTTGTVGKAGTGMARQALQKLESAKHLGKPMTAAEEYLLSRATGKGVTVLPTAEELSKSGFSKIKGMVGK